MNIYNSNGSVWEVVSPTEFGPALQRAIDEQAAEGGGSVWVDTGFTVSISRAIQLRNYVHLDLQHSWLALTSDITCFSLVGCSQAQVHNVQISVAQPQQTQPIILLNSDASYIQNDYNTFSRIHIRNVPHCPDFPADYCQVTSTDHCEAYENCLSGTFANHGFDAIVLRTSGGSVSNNHFEHVYMEGVAAGIRLQITAGTNSLLEGNSFVNFFMNAFETLIYLDNGAKLATPHIDYNLFYHITGQCKPISDTNQPYTCYGVRDICGTGNHFDHIMAYDWWYVEDASQYWPQVNSNTALADWIISDKARDTYVCAEYIARLQDRGTCSLYIPKPDYSV